MESWPQLQPHSDPLPPHCDPQGAFLTWLSSATSTCVPTPLALVTTVLGSISFLAWLFAQLPQIYKNCKLQSTSGLSIYFLVEWLLGDTTNLVGAILTKQAAWQVLVASYYTLVDCVMCGQYLYYTKYKADCQPALVGIPVEDTRSLPDSRDEIRSKPLTIPFSGFSFLSSTPREKGTPSYSRSITRIGNNSLPPASPKTVIMLSMLLAVLARASPLPPAEPNIASTETSSEVAGRFISWASTFLYLGSRLPQIFKNAKRQSTSGLSLSLFVAAFFGNFFYSASLLTNPLAWSSYPPHGGHGWADSRGSDRREWVLLALPFFLGAAGVLALDLTIGIQFMIYGERMEKKVAEVQVGEERRGRWNVRRVSGWMRGWVPSPGPKVIDVQRRGEDRAPLLESEERRSGSDYGGT
ncbi:MAG: hypothetical protein MMC23_006671 [Stictis urceolatum]|nr:hypothetical protein [Stictis urceolata]